MRRATVADLPVLVELGRVMHAESPNYRHLGFDERKVSHALGRSISDGPCFVHLDQAGAIDGGFAAVVGERWFSRDRVVSDLALFVRPNRRGGMAAFRLITAFLDWCEESGFAPHEVMVGITTGVHRDETRRLYERMQFEDIGDLFRLRSY